MTAASYDGMPRRFAARVRRASRTRRRVHARVLATNMTVVAETVVGGSTNASTPALSWANASRCLASAESAWRTCPPRPRRFPPAAPRPPALVDPGSTLQRRGPDKRLRFIPATDRRVGEPVKGRGSSRARRGAVAGPAAPCSTSSTSAAAVGATPCAAGVRARHDRGAGREGQARRTGLDQG